MKAFLLHGKEDLRLADLAMPQPAPGGVVIAVRRAGICGSDVHYYSHGRVGNFVPRRPFVLGHEFAGEIVATAPDTDPALLGQRVAVDPSIPCSTCSYCRGGRYNLCENMRFYGSASCDPHIDGGFAEYVTAPAANCFVLGNRISWGEAAMIEPLSVAVHAVNRAGSVAGKSALVTGGGAIGQLIALVLRAFGARIVALSDLDRYPRDLALACGADLVLAAGAPEFNAELLAAVPGGVDFVFEASGSPRALEQGVNSARRGATIVQVGTLPPEVTLPLNAVMQRELNLIGSFRFANVFGVALDLIESGRLDLKPLITNVLPLADAVHAMHLAVDKVRTIKVQIEP